MATTWSPRTQFDRKSWLLANGEIVHEPPLEETPSGRKVRVAGTSLTAYSRDLDDLIMQAVRQTAQAKNTQVWMPLSGRERAEEGQVGFNTNSTKASLHFLHDTKNNHAATRLWWRFAHPELPVEAVLAVTIQRVRYWDESSPQMVKAQLVAPPTHADGHSISASAVSEEGHVFHSFISNGTLDYDLSRKVHQWYHDNPPNWDATILGSRQFTTERAAVEALLKLVRQIDNMATLQIPDLRDPLQPAYLELPESGNNLNSQFMSDLTEYLDGAPSVEKAQQLYNELRTTLRTLGIVFDDTTTDDFQRALLGDDKRALEVQVDSPAEEGGPGVHDGHHTLSVNLATGTFVVNCSLRHASQGEIAEKWEEALTMASLTGQEDALLAYARKYAQSAMEERAKTILRERQTGNTA